MGVAKCDAPNGANLIDWVGLVCAIWVCWVTHQVFTNYSENLGFISDYEEPQRNLTSPLEVYA